MPDDILLGDRDARNSTMSDVGSASFGKAEEEIVSRNDFYMHYDEISKTVKNCKVLRCRFFMKYIPLSKA